MTATQPDKARTRSLLDARKIRSRDAMCKTLLNMLEHQPLEQISIRDIAKEAGVGHATFYRHYPTKEALLEDLAEDEIRRLVDLSLPLLDSANSIAACAALCSCVNERRTLWTTLLTGGAAGAVREELLRISIEVAATRPLYDSLLPTDLAVILSVSSMIELLAWWLRHPNPPSVEEVALMLDHIIHTPATD